MFRIVIKQCLKLLKKIFIVLLTSIVNFSNHTKCLSLSNQKWRLNLPLLIYILMNTVKNFKIR